MHTAAWVITVGLVGCTEPDPGEGIPPQVELGEVRELSRPQRGLHHHATAAWAGDDLAVAWTAGFDPQTGAWFRIFDGAGTAISPLEQLNPSEQVGDKPDVAGHDRGFLTAWDDRASGVWLRALDVEGFVHGQELLLQDSVGFTVDAVDLAVRPDGSGIAIWTESGAEWMGPDDGRIVFRAFDEGLVPQGPPRIVETSSRKTSDAAPLADGGVVAVWARHHDHPTDPSEVYYEVHGRLYRDDGSTASFRADDLDSAWPSRPAVAVHPDTGQLAVSWRDKRSSRGAYDGAYGRLFDADGVPLGPSVALGPGGDGNRVVTTWAGEWAVFGWEETGPDGLPGVFLAVLDGATGGLLLPRTQVSDSGGDRDGRPSIVAREIDGGQELMFVWETLRPGADLGEGLRSRRVRLLR